MIEDTVCTQILSQSHEGELMGVHFTLGSDRGWADIPAINIV